MDPNVILCILIVYILTIQASLSIPTEEFSNNCGNSLSEDSPSVNLVVGSISKEFHLFYEILQINCSARYPIQWTFDNHPYFLEEEQTSISKTGGHLTWNASYIRVADDVFQESGVLFNTTLSFKFISIPQLRHIGPNCQGVKDPCRSSSAVQVLAKDKNQSEWAEPLGSFRNVSAISGNCSLDLWFDEYTQLFFCKGREPHAIPTMTYRYCANPTECGLFSVDRTNNLCGDVSRDRQHRKKCGKREENCQDISIGTEFPVPKVVSCWDRFEGRLSNSTVKLMGYFHSIKEVDGRPASSYINWEEADPEDLVSIQSSKQKVMANESFDVACLASYYYFAQGMHLTFKHLSDPRFVEMDVVLLPLFNLPTIEETLEVWNHSTNKNDSSSSPQGIALKRNLLAQNFLLPAGDYEFTCYSPVWNSSQWITKTLLVSVSNISLPTFVTGNMTRSIDFSARRNVTCLAKGIPPPKLSWTFENEELERNVLMTNGGETKALSWSVITLPDKLEGFRYTFKCKAENPAGFDEKVFVVNKDGEHVAMSTKIAAFVVVIGFIGNLIVGYFCWKYLFADDESELAAVTFLRNLWHGKVACCSKKTGDDGTTTPNCDHPTCRQKMTQTP